MTTNHEQRKAAALKELSAYFTSGNEFNFKGWAYRHITIIRELLQSAKVDNSDIGLLAREKLGDAQHEVWIKNENFDKWCYLQSQIKLGTEITMHKSWRKRAEESEAEIIALKEKLDGLVKALENLSTISNNPMQICDTFEYRAVRLIAKQALQQFSGKEEV